MRLNYSKVTDYQIRQLLKSVTGDADAVDTTAYPSVAEVFSAFHHSGVLDLPVDDPESLFVFDMRIAIRSDILMGKRSLLLRQLFDRHAETGVVVDAMLTGGKSVFLARLLPGKMAVLGWIERMRASALDALIQKIDDENILIVSPLSSFVAEFGA